MESYVMRFLESSCFFLNKKINPGIMHLDLCVALLSFSSLLFTASVPLCGCSIVYSVVEGYRGACHMCVRGVGVHVPHVWGIQECMSCVCGYSSTCHMCGGCRGAYHIFVESRGACYICGRCRGACHMCVGGIRVHSTCG